MNDTERAINDTDFEFSLLLGTVNSPFWEEMAGNGGKELWAIAFSALIHPDIITAGNLMPFDRISLDSTNWYKEDTDLHIELVRVGRNEYSFTIWHEDSFKARLLYGRGKESTLKLSSDLASCEPEDYYRKQKYIILAMLATRRELEHIKHEGTKQ